VLARDDVDIVDVCTPPSIRHVIVVAAARAGKHVLAEKPIATVPRVADEMVRVPRDAGVAFGIVHNYSFLPEFLAARAILEPGEIGEVEVAILNYLGVLDNPGSSEYQPGWRRTSAVAGGGVLMDMMHVAYVAELLLGRHMRRVSAYVDAREHGSAVEDLALCRFEADGAVALVNIGWGAGPGGIEISGAEGRLIIRYAQAGTSPFYPLEHVAVVGRNGETVHEIAANGRTSHELLLAEYAEALRAGRDALAPGEEGRRVLELVLAAYESAALERPVELPLAEDDPVYQLGVAGMSELEVSRQSRLASRHLFGVG
jgi:predicted dehydrogenase